MRSVFLRRTCGISLLLAVAGALPPSSAQKPKEIVTTPDAIYDQLYPVYAEVCASSQYQEKSGANGGGFGHGLMFLKGACRVNGADYPTVETCDNGPGVGISTYFAFKNVNWVAVEGKDFFMKGGVRDDEPLTAATVQTTIRKGMQQEILKGVVMHDWIMNGRPKDEDVEVYRYRMSLGTDFGSNFGRNTYCVRIPMTKPMMQKTVDHLNQVQRVYAEQGNTYVWDVVKNNCTHTVHNAVGASGAWPQKELDLKYYTQIVARGFSPLAIPFNSVLHTLRDTTTKDLPDFETLRLDSTMRRALLENGFMLRQPGSIIDLTPVHEFQNDYFVTDSPHNFLEGLRGVIREALKLPPSKRPGKYQQEFQDALEDPRYTDIRSNLEWFVEKYDFALAKLNSEGNKRAIKNKRFSTEDTELYYAYRDYLTSMRADTLQKIALLDRVQGRK